MKNYSLTIGWLYPELMSTYGDRGNIITLQRRCQWRGIEAKILYLNFGFRVSDLKACDMLFMGGAQDKQQKIVSSDLKKKKPVLKEMIENEIPGLYICGAYQFLGKYYKEADGTIIEGLGILDLFTENPGENVGRLIGNVVVRWSFDFAQDDNDSIIVGFENHGGRTYLGKNIKPLGKVLAGFGNNGKDQTEGAIYKNSFGTYLHGPILPKNPHFSDLLIQKALQKKYGSPIDLSPLNDDLEWQAHKTIVKRLDVSI
ncbi:MAG: type 1 glutamine amidotransferase [Candidatus Levybacteria bacterium]|nr:type 1 glutamine amidotransferase [Candidatus Levybacteria bacterium]MBI3093230.1 type 1 glutamine amidotransferase [Candidatus Levybacteria bacterium]